jgi:hypothetical protein
LDARGNHESLDIEPADEIPDAGAGRIGINVADIPGEPERRVWNLNREQVELGVRRQVMDDDFKIFECAEGMICDRAAGLEQAARRLRTWRFNRELDSFWIRLCLDGRERGKRRGGENIMVSCWFPSFSCFSHYFRRTRRVSDRLKD